MLILSSIGRIATRYSAARARYRSERTPAFAADRLAQGHRLA